MNSNKITNSLKNYLHQTESEKEIEVVIELNPVQREVGFASMSKNEKTGFLKQAFDDELQPVANEISNQGGNISGSAWLNQTIEARVPVKSIAEIANLKQVHAIDLPNQITRD